MGRLREIGALLLRGWGAAPIPLRFAFLLILGLALFAPRLYSRPLVWLFVGILVLSGLSRIIAPRILHTVSGKLAAFYLNAALWPLALALALLPFAGCTVLGQVSAQVVGLRLGRLIAEAERRAEIAEASYWRARAAGAGATEAARASVYAGCRSGPGAGITAWAWDDRGYVSSACGDTAGLVPSAPAWLGDRSFAGLAWVDSTWLELRTRRRLVDRGGVLDLCTAMRLAEQHLTSPFETPAGGSTPEPAGRTSGIAAYPVREGLLTIMGLQFGTSRLSTATVDYRRGRIRGWNIGVAMEEEVRDTTQASPLPWVLQKVKGVGKGETLFPRSLGETRLRSRFPIVLWTYRADPIEWSSGQPVESGVLLQVRFALEAAFRALFRSGLGVGPVIGWTTLGIVALLVFYQIYYTIRGIRYARSISGAIARLDRGVQAIRAGNFGHRVEPRERDQLGLLTLTFNDMSRRLGELMEERAAHQVLERELAIAHEVQSRLFPEAAPRDATLEARGVCRPARGVSGDYYDFIPLGDGYDVLVADVSGKGVSAALLMAGVHAALRAQYPVGPSRPPEPGEILTCLNRQLHERIEPSRFVTLFLVRYRGDRRLGYGNAGHNPAALVRRSDVEWLQAGAPMLGPLADQRYDTCWVDVEPGDLVCLYTDGVTEAESPSGEQFGEERLAETLRAHADEALKRAGFPGGSNP